jgi:hypothetical protein
LVACDRGEVAALPTETPTRATVATYTPFPTATARPTSTPVPTATTRPVTPTPAPSPTPDPNIDPLTGLPVADAALLARRVLAVRVGNDPEIRPQDGLGSAEIVYEEIMDGWAVTRFTAIYLEPDVERIRPIRSARLSSLAIAPQYGAVLVHSGASDKIRWLISQARDFTDLDQYYHDAPYGMLAGYDWRGRMYTSVVGVHEYLKAKGWESDERPAGHAFSTVVPHGQPGVTVHIPYPRTCVVDWQYDAAMGRYLRSQQGQPHLDALTQQQIGAENVIIFYTEHKTTDIVEDSLGSTAIDIVMAGSGRAQLLRDGVMQEVRWEQKDPGGLVQYYDTSGTLAPLKPGQTWVQLVPTDYAVEVKG